MTDRKSGYYWTKYCYKWFIFYWNDYSKCWFANEMVFSPSFIDRDMEEIDETRIQYNE